MARPPLSSVSVSAFYVFCDCGVGVGAVVHVDDDDFGVDDDSSSCVLSVDAAVFVSFAYDLGVGDAWCNERFVQRRRGSWPC